MSVEGGVAQPGSSPTLPPSIWVVAWASLAGQVIVLVRQGLRDDNELSLVTSVVLGALIVGYVSAGVVRARTARVVLAFVVLGLSLIAELVALVSSDDPAEAGFDLLSLATTVVALFALVGFCRSGWYTWQRTRPSTDEGAPTGQLVVIGVLVGVLGGLTGPVEEGFEMRVSVAEQWPAPSRP